MNGYKATRGSILERIREARNNESGFTLIELLIVVIVLGILAAIVLFALGSFTKDSAAAACKTDGKQVETADTAYFAKNGNHAADIATLVSSGYLKSAPKTDNYTISLGAGGVVTGALDAGNGGGACYPA